jgi:hypothetical protein
MAMVIRPDVRVQMADKAAMRQVLEEQDARAGFIPDPNATPQRAREMMLADGIRPEDNAFSLEVIRAREEE